MSNKDTTQQVMNINRITLEFPKKDEISFRKKYFADSINHIRIAFLLLIMLYASFGYLDSIKVPEYADIFFMIRYYFVVPTLSLVYILSYCTFFNKIWQILLGISFIVAGVGITLMTMLVPENYAYYAGMMLIFSAGYFFIKLRFFYASIAGWSTLLIFNIVEIFFTQSSTTELINNNFFFISANLIGMFAAYNIEYYARLDFFTNQKLDEQNALVIELNKNLEKKVIKRTQQLLVAKEQAEKNEQLYEDLVQSSHNLIWRCDLEGKYTFLNSAWEKTHGYKIEEMLGRPFSDFQRPEISKRDTEEFKKYFESGIVKDYESTHIIKDGSEIPLIFNALPLLNSLGEIIGTQGTAFDISKLKKTELKLINAKEKAEESDRLKSAFLANMSHEIRTPMNGIIGFASLLKNPALTGKEQQKYIKIIQKGGERMLNIINDIISISRIESGQLEINIQETNINEQIEYIYTFFKPEIEAKGMQLSFKNTLPSSEAILKTDRDKLYGILTNLVKNAIKYSLKGTIEIGYTVNDNQIEFYVKDTGIGIPEDRQEAIFERFIQADIADKMALQGAGLGLSISKAYVEMLGGSIWLESKENDGSTFYFTLPYHIEKDEKLELKNSNILRKDKDQTQSLKMLIAEDDTSSVILISIIVENICSEILKAKNGEETVEICRKNPDLDLILMDIQMPDMNGLEATREIRKFNEKIIIIAQTAYGLEGDRQKALDAGCNDYITKPIIREKLLNLIQRNLKKA